MDQEIIDKIAKAFISGMNDALDKHVKPISFEEVKNDPRYGIMEGAKRAIKAIREPTAKMCIKGAMTLPDYDPSVDDAEDCWKNMIDSILGT